jgi:hypothetical protein
MAWSTRVCPIESDSGHLYANLPTDYYVSPIWAESLRDADRVEEKFYHYCRRAGPLCAIYRDGDTQDSIRARVQGVFLALNKDPLSGVSPYSN